MIRGKFSQLLENNVFILKSILNGSLSSNIDGIERISNFKTGIRVFGIFENVKTNCFKLKLPKYLI